MTQITSSLQLSSAENGPSLIKRQSKPSQFASSIKSFKQLCDRSCKRAKSDNPQPDQTSAENQQATSNRYSSLKCHLPSGKKLNLSVTFKKKNIKKGKKHISFKVGAEKDTEVCPNEPTTNSPPGFDLLSKFLLAAEELNKLEQEQKEKQKIELKQPLLQKDEAQIKKETRVRSQRDENEKLQRFVERSTILSSRLQSLLCDMSYL